MWTDDRFLPSAGRTPRPNNWSEPALVAGAAAAGAAVPWGAAAASRRSADADSSRSPFASLESTRSGHRPPTGDPDPLEPVGMVPLNAPSAMSPESSRPLPLPPGAAPRATGGGHKRSGSQEMMVAAALALEEYRRSAGTRERNNGHQRSISHELPERNTPSPAKHSRTVSASRALLQPLPGLNRPSPGPIMWSQPLAATAGGDMMLSPFGPPPPPPSHSGSGSHSHPSTGISTGFSMPSAQSFVFPQPPGNVPQANWSVPSLTAEQRHSGTTASADGSGRRGSAPRTSSYDEFGTVGMHGAASRVSRLLSTTLVSFH